MNIWRTLTGAASDWPYYDLKRMSTTDFRPEFDTAD